MTGGIKVDTREFRKALNEYRKLSKRDIPAIINTKAFYIARGAVRNTLKTPKEKIKNQLMQPSNIAPSAPLAAIIINSVLGGGKGTGKHLDKSLPKSIWAMVKNGKRGLQGADMKKAVKTFVASAVRTRAFLASGFLEAVKDFGRLAEKKIGAAAMDRTVKRYGKAKGSAVTAKQDAWVARAVITNSASGKSEKSGAALMKHAGAALQQAFNDEVASMRQYVRDKMQKTANKFNAKKH